MQDSVGPHTVITCGSVSGKLYLSKFDESKKPLPKCICVNGNWCSPSDVESLAGKKAKKCKQSLRHLDKPLSDYILSGSHVKLVSRALPLTMQMSLLLTTQVLQGLSSVVMFLIMSLCQCLQVA